MCLFIDYSVFFNLVLWLHINVHFKLKNIYGIAAIGINN